MKRGQASAQAPRRRMEVLRGREDAKLAIERAEQAAELERIRRELARLNDVIAARDAELERVLNLLPPAQAQNGEAEQVRYRRAIQRLRRLVYERVERGRPAVVITAGDESLLQHAGGDAVHLLRDPSGRYSGRQPESSRSAIVQLEAARSQGAEVLVIPESVTWWLEHYAGLAGHLKRRYALVASEPGVGSIWDLEAPSPLRELDDLIGELCAVADEPAILDWQAGPRLAPLLPDYNVFTTDQDGALPYLDASIDIVAIGDPTPEIRSEAERVAAKAVVTFSGRQEQPSVKLVQLDEADGRRPQLVSVVIVCGEGEAPSPAFLRQLEEARPRTFETEVLLPLTRGTAPPRTGPDVHVIQCRGKSLGARLKRAASTASGDVLVIIDANYWPLPGWLPPLVAPLDRADFEVGIVAALMATPDGRVAAAGSREEGNATQYEELGAVRHSYVRPVSGAAGGLFATDRQLLLDQASRWSRHVDPSGRYCRAVREAGMSVLCQPESVAIRAWDAERAASGVNGGIT